MLKLLAQVQSRLRTGENAMGNKSSKRKFTRRDKLITLASYGKITPEEAEAEAAAKSWRPFAQQPALPTFDPMIEPLWPIVMAVAWIAWRDINLVRENWPEFRAECTQWVFRPWMEPTQNGKEFKRREGWLLEAWTEATTARLGLLEALMADKSELPQTRRMSVGEAKMALWSALSEGHPAAEGIDRNGQPVEIPRRAWSYLKLFEERNRDVFKYQALHRQEPYSQVRLRRDDLFKIWPAAPEYKPATTCGTIPIQPAMLGRLFDTGPVGYVALCAAIHWIMTKGGTRHVMIDDQVVWDDSVKELWPYIDGGEIELNGLRAGHAMPERIPAHSLTLVKVFAPLSDSIGDMLVSSPSHIDCTVYDSEFWAGHFNDRLYEYGRTGPAWTHLQVPKKEILKRWPRPVSNSRSAHDSHHWLVEQIRQSPDRRPKSKAAFWLEAQEKFPSLRKSRFHLVWTAALAEVPENRWSEPGRPPGKSNHRIS